MKRSTRRKPLLGMIRRFFDASDNQVFGRKQLEQVIAENRNAWHLPRSSPIKTLIAQVLLPHTELREVRLVSSRRSDVRYACGSVTPYQVALSAGRDAYLSHLTAMHLHRLANGPHKDVYVNIEQSPKTARVGSMTQESIDSAFKRPPRVTSQRTTYDGHIIHNLNGQYTGRLGVTKIVLNGIGLPITGIERTLVDVAVRPHYSGGVASVLQAYAQSRNRFSAKRLLAILEDLNFLYPYHQAIGFYLDRGRSCDQWELELFERMPREFDFYLDHQMTDIAYDPKWRVYYPKPSLAAAVEILE